MADFNKFDGFVEALAEKVHNLGSDALKIALTNTAPEPGDVVLADLTEITPGNGYVSGGLAVTVTGSSQTSGVYSLQGSAVTFAASGGSLGPFQFAVIYNDTASGKPLIGWWDNSSAVTLADGETFPVTFAGDEILRLQ